MSTIVSEAKMPAFPIFADTLQRLGYFCDSQGRIRKIKKPDEGFVFDKSKGEHHAKLEAHALQQAVRSVVFSTLTNMGMQTVKIPKSASDSEPHSRILISPNIRASKHVVVLCGDETEDLGIFSYLDTFEKSIHFGTVLGFVMNFTQGCLRDDTALIILNPAQCYWNPQTELAESLETFRLRGSTSMITPVRDPARRNVIPGNNTAYEHTQYVFDHVILPCVKPTTSLNIVGVAAGGLAVYQFLKRNWMFWRRFTSTMQLIDPRHIFDPNTIPTLTNEWSWATFMRDRTRAWVRSDLPRGDHEVGIGARGCNCFAAGESIHVNAMLPRCMEKAAAWMHLMNSSELAKEVPSLVEGEAFMLERINPNGPPALHDWTGSFVLNNLLRLSWCGSPTQLRGYELELKIFGRSINGMGGCSPAEHFDATIRRLYEFLEELERGEGGGGGVVAEGDDVVLMGEDDAAL